MLLVLVCFFGIIDSTWNFRSGAPASNPGNAHQYATYSDKLIYKQIYISAQVHIFDGCIYWISTIGSAAQQLILEMMLELRRQLFVLVLDSVKATQPKSIKRAH